MKSLNIKFALTGCALASLIFASGCQNDFDNPPMVVPQATMKANTTIAELKAMTWKSDANYAEMLGKNDEGQDIIIHGRVISSDAAGNVYKAMYIQDETDAITLSINQNSLYNDYRIGQEIVLNVTGLYVGKYAALQQIGGLGDYNGTPQVSFMAYETFTEHVESNGLPNGAMTFINYGDPRPTDGSMYCTVMTLEQLSGADVQEMQSQYVEFRNVHFPQGGLATFADHQQNTSRDIADEANHTIVMRTSGYSTFYNETLPTGTGTVRGLLSYFNGSWQLIINSLEDVIFDTKGEQSEPYTVAEAIELQDSGTAGWVQGYIVGSVKAGVSQISGNDDIIWSADADMDNTLVIGATADTKDIKEALVMELAQGSELRRVANLVDNPGAYREEIKVRGTMATFLGTYGITGNNGSTAEFVLEGYSPSTPPATGGVGQLYEGFEGGSVPSGWTVVATSGNLNWYVTDFSNNYYAAASAYKGTATGGPYEEWLITPALDMSKMTTKTLTFRTQGAYPNAGSSLEVFAMTSANPEQSTNTKLNAEICTPGEGGSTYSPWKDSGTVDLSAFTGTIYIGFCYKSEKGGTDNSATYCVDDVNIGAANAGGNTGGGTTPDTPDGPATGAGSKDEPFNVEYVLGTSSDIDDVWVEGYIVGWVDGQVYTSGCNFNATDATKTNILLGPTADTTDSSKCIPVQVPAGSLRDSLSLGGDPSMYKKHVKLHGQITRYFGVRGFKNTTEFEVIE